MPRPAYGPMGNPMDRAQGRPTPPPPPGWRGQPPGNGGKGGPPPPPPGWMAPPVPFNSSKPSNPFNPSKPPARPGASSILFAGKSKQKRKDEKRSPLMIPVKPVQKKVPEDVERIADYKVPEAKDGNLGDETGEGVMPSDEMKKRVARHYLLKWTTEWEAGRGVDKGQESEDANTPEDPEV